VLVLAPFGRDAEAASWLLSREAITVRICADVEALYSALDEQTGAVLVAEEALVKGGTERLAAWLEGQPTWSDLPFIVLTSATHAARRSRPKLDLPEQLGNVMFLERPLNALTLVSAVRTVLRARRRQYQIRNEFEARERMTVELVDANRRTNEILESIGDAFYALDRDTRLLYVNHRAAALWNKQANEILGRRFLDVFPQAAGTEPWLRHEHVFRAREPVHIETISPVLKRWISASIYPAADGGVTVYFRDVSARKETEQALRESERQFRTLADTIPQLAWMAQPDGWIFWYNRRWYDYTGTTPQQMEGWGWQSVHDPAELPRVLERWHASISTGQPFDMVFPLKGTDGLFRPFLTRVLPLLNEQGRVARWFGTNTDVSEQAEHERRLRLLVEELNHRVKNTLATIQSIATMTYRSAESPETFWKGFEGRILGLSKTHNLLSASQWDGIALRDILCNELDPYDDESGRRVRLMGPPVRLDSKTAVALGMAVHELATNAAKYGALSTREGRVNVIWRMEANGGKAHLAVTWSESGGPPVKPPQRRGFGSRLIERGLAHELRGDIRIEYRPEGVCCTVNVPLPEGSAKDQTALAGSVG
jgi:PAS domain S-box-containing protein